ncbi:MAG: DUF1311 domain-containing protein [Acidithiobacillus sp.]|nr:DUF1311 domain-containing protein [Acidithiobacillus sp.]
MKYLSMKSLWVAAAAALCLAPGAAQASDPCKTPNFMEKLNKCDGNTLEKGECVDEVYVAADEALNKAYQELLKHLRAQSAVIKEAHAERKAKGSKDSSGEEFYLDDTIKSLVAAQRAWIAYRDKECDAYNILYSTGTFRSYADVYCSIKLTQQRIQDLCHWGE